MNSAVIAGAVRHVAGFAGAYFVSKGWLGEDQIELFIGAAVAVAALVWSIYDKKGRA